jgi:hypothetical protein
MQNFNWGRNLEGNSSIFSRKFLFAGNDFFWGAVEFSIMFYGINCHRELPNYYLAIIFFQDQLPPLDKREIII